MNSEPLHTCKSVRQQNYKNTAQVLYFEPVCHMVNISFVIMLDSKRNKEKRRAYCHISALLHVPQAATSTIHSEQHKSHKY